MVIDILIPALEKISGMVDFEVPTHHEGLPCHFRGQVMDYPSMISASNIRDSDWIFSEQMIKWVLDVYPCASTIIDEQFHCEMRK